MKVGVTETGFVTVVVREWATVNDVERALTAMINQEHDMGAAAAYFVDVIYVAVAKP